MIGMLSRIALVSAIIIATAANMAMAADKPVTVVMLGDSTTLSSRNKPGDKLNDCVQTSLSKLLQKKGVEVKVINSGKGGDTAKGGYRRLEKDVFAHAPDVVAISFGLNDSVKHTPDEFAAWLEKIVKAIRKKSKAKILLVTSTPFDDTTHALAKKYAKTGGLDKHLDMNYCARMRTIATKHKVPLCDLHREFIKEFREREKQGYPPLVADVILPDGVHLTDEGNRLMAKYLAPAIHSILTDNRK
jgi:lysophospholipase L1-like esterase